MIILSKDALEIYTGDSYESEYDAPMVKALVFSARLCCRRSRVRAPVWPGTFRRRNINIY
jgi:hypothetical protein